MKISKILSLLIAFAIVLSVFCVSASAAMINFKPVAEAGNICGVALKTPQTVLRDLFADRAVKIYSGRTELAHDSDVILGTGFTIKLDNRSFYNLVVMGDIDGDGDLSSMDYVLVKRGVLGTYDLNPAQMRAADVGVGEELRAINYIKVKRAYFGTYDINKKYTCEPYESGKPQDGWSEGWV